MKSFSTLLSAASEAAMNASGRTAAVTKLGFESFLRFESGKRRLDLPLAEIGGLTTADFFRVPDDPKEIEAIATQIAIWAGAGHYHHLQSREDAALVEDGLRILLKPIGEAVLCSIRSLLFCRTRRP